ncbi:MAG TPA: delta-60 repeat domain-containing protein [Tepidisphaeraceae bacterium]|jgi:uncharacterized delta-60 repeat protein|nr:delta-60 repeat domain-containing protein [Tepidisphaeraceae bacterium]
MLSAFHRRFVTRFYARFHIGRSSGTSPGNVSPELLEPRRLLSAYTLSALANFDGMNQSLVYSDLIMDPAGNLYGASSSGGANSDGAIFELVKGSTTVTNLASFNGTNGSDPVAGLTLDPSGNLFGVASTGGAQGAGDVFELAKGSNTISVVASFDGSDGSDPEAPLIIDSSGNLFGSTAQGGGGESGAVFEVASGSNAITMLAFFDGTNGAEPKGALAMDSSGNLFGTAEQGGSASEGTLFELVSGSSTITSLGSFNAASDGSSPVGGVILDSSGDLFGTTTAGGSTGNGSIFELPAGSGTISTVASFTGLNGSDPVDRLFIDGNGDLFGTANTGGASFTTPGTGDGTAFDVIDGIITDLDDFNGTNGQDPFSGLVQDSSGNFYGTDILGGTSNAGTIFEMSPIPGPASQLVFTSQPTTTVVDSPITPAVSVSVEDASGVLVNTDNSTITLSLAGNPGGAALGGTLSAQAVNGVATFTGLSLNEAGTFDLEAADGSLTGAESSGFTITPLPPSQLAFSASPTGGVAGSALGAVSVNVEDSSGSIVTDDDSTVTLAIASGPSGATLGGTLSETSINGIATFGDLSLNEAGTFTLTATDGSLTAATSASLALTPAPPAPPSQLAFATIPITAVIGAELTPAITVSVEDANNNVVSTDNSTITLSIASGPAGASFGETVSSAAVDGAATFTNLPFNLAGDYTLTASDGTLTSATSNSIAVYSAAKIGALDPAFGIGGLASHSIGLSSTAGLALQSDGKSIIAGSVGSPGSQLFGITRYNADGSVDTTFGDDGITDTSLPGSAQAIAQVLLSDGDILVAGTDTTFVNDQATGSQFALAEYTSAGQLDTAFGNGNGFVLTGFSATGALSNDTVAALAVGSDGTIYLGGSSDANGHGLDFAIAAYAPNGNASSTFGASGKVLLDFSGGDDAINALAFNARGELIAGGTAADASTGVSSVALAEFLPNGTLDPKFGLKGKITQSVGGVYDAASALAVDPKGNIVVGGVSATGSASAGSLSANFLLLRYTSAGKLDKTFGAHGIVDTSFNQPAAVTTVLIDPDGTVIASGKTTATLAGLNPAELDIAIARYTSKGQLDTTFNGTGQAIINLAASPTPTSLTTPGNQPEQPAIASNQVLLPFDTTAQLMMEFDEFKQSTQGVVTMTPGGELAAIGNSDGNTVEATIVTSGLDLAATLMTAFPQSVVGGGKGTATVVIREAGTSLVSGTYTLELFASNTQYVASTTTAFGSIPEKLKLKTGMAKSLHIKFAYPSSLAQGDYYLVAAISPGTAADLNLSNNSSESTAPVLIAPPFVLLSGSALSAPTFAASKPALVSITLTNAGNITAAAESAVEFFASPDGALADAIPLPTVPLRLNLKPNTPHVYRLKLSLPSNLPANTYVLLALLDPANVFNDPNAATNFIASGNSFTVTA